MTSDTVRVLPDGIDASARQAAVDPTQNVVLEASAGTGKTRVLVERYVNLLLAGVDPDNILAITFTRKAAAEMRSRIVERLKEASRLSQLDAARWRDLCERSGDIAISTIDAFCLSLLREFPLEADVDPGFSLADDTEVARLTEESLDRALRICRSQAGSDDDVALVFAQLGEQKLRAGLSLLLDRRLVAPAVLRRFLQQGPRELTASGCCKDATDRLVRLFADLPGGVDAFLKNGPLRQPAYAMLAEDIRELCGRPDAPPRPSEVRALIDCLRGYFLTQQGEPRKAGFAGTGYRAEDCASAASWKRHRQTAAELAPALADVFRAFRRDLNVVMSRGVWRIFAVALTTYRQTLDAHALLDFSGVLERAVDLLKQMDEFARSRYRLEARYHHVLVDEFQDTSRAQWELVSLLIRSWGEGLGVAAGALAPSIFVVGDRKQSIYGFRDADVAVLDDAAAFVQTLRPDSQPRRAITVSFRAVPQLLAFVNDVFDEVEKADGRRDAFRYDERDRFPAEMELEQPDAESPLGLIVAGTVRATADLAADEIVRLLSSATVRDRRSGVRRLATPADIGILFRSRESHREFESALERRGVSTCVYKGLGFFDAPEIQDAVALLRFLARPTSDLRAAAFLRSRLVRISDDGVRRLSPALAGAVIALDPPEVFERLCDEDRRVLSCARAAVAGWLKRVDRVTPAELLAEALRETAYPYELRGPRRLQARENLKKLGGLVRRIQNRGYATLERIAEHLDRLAVGDESNAAIDAVDAVSLMTVHAAKGLEFPIVFVVNMGRGTGTTRPPIRVGVDGPNGASIAIADYQSESDEDAQVREREETKRLLYVALTRARDRLYLSATLSNGVCRMGRGSLGEVLPRSLAALFTRVGVGGDAVWTTSSGRQHRLQGSISAATGGS
ncbi:MAG TPA: UvrD-helicase domain-containing protein [Vicinamibacterales bacterium]|nr:UvrD-helicase domain-containing protein [Vicinamibacterales bacterium]